MPQTSEATPNRPYIGGQAVLEGVMMRAPRSFAIVVRRRDGSLVVREREVVNDTRGWRKLPFLRGINSLVESLRLGGEALRFSASQLEADMLAEEQAGLNPEKRPDKAAENTAVDVTMMPPLGILSAFGLSLFSMMAGDTETPAEKKEAASKGGIVMLVVAVAFLIALPQAAAAGANRLMHWNLAVQSPAFQALTGGFKLSVVLGYLLMIRRVPEIRRVFQYHGAEHKTISTYEANEELIVQNARTKTTLHPRCGTTFLVMVALMSVILFTIIGGVLPRIATGSALLDNLAFFVEKLPFLPLLAGVTFEIQRIFARYCTTGPLRALLWPGFMVQKITTIEPDDDQLEVALASLRATLFRERGIEAGNQQEDIVFSNYEAIAQAERLRAA
ncbi:MAG: DUF1385 domain-containing protein [Polyangiaceae bacterium]